LQTAPPTLARLLENKVVVDPSNPLGFDESGQMIRTLPDGLSAGSVVAALLPAGTHYVKAFGTLAADALASAANRERQQAVLFHATDDDTAATTIERLTRAAGFEPLKAGTVERVYTPIRDEGVDESGVPVVEVAAEVLQRDVTVTDVVVRILEPIRGRDSLRRGVGVSGGFLHDRRHLIQRLRCRLTRQPSR
jgi:hypothetical protein